MSCGHSHTVRKERLWAACVRVVISKSVRGVQRVVEEGKGVWDGYKARTELSTRPPLDNRDMKKIY